MLWNPQDYKQFTFFWCDQNGLFSQWEKSPFILDDILYPTAEHFMMMSKARLFNDMETFHQMTETASPKVVKALGRQVSGFCQKTWDKVAKLVVYRGNYAKYTQNLDLATKLLDTAGTLMVEASPYDKIWGIGLTAEAAQQTDPLHWPGRNWLGEILTKVRERLIQES